MPDKKSVLLPLRRTAVVGSGLAGLTAGILLKQAGHEVVVFEKSRGPGGRLAAKRVSGGSADMGAQYFTARNPTFLPFLRQFSGPSAFAPWQGDLGFKNASGTWESFPSEPRYVGAPRMTAITRALSRHVELMCETRVKRFARNGNQWSLFDTQDSPLGDFDQIVLTAPPAQSRDMLADSDLAVEAAQLNEFVEAVLPCWAVAAHFNRGVFERYQGMRVEHPVLYWVANNSSKPGREGPGEWWVLHADPKWSVEHVDTPPEEVSRKLVDAFRALVGCPDSPDEVVVHRWLYARSAGGPAPGCLWHPDLQIGLAGDWLSGGRVEGAFNSASSLVQAMVAG